MGKKLSLFAVAMMNVVIVASLQMMTACATYGYSLLFFYLIAALAFFIPYMLIISELSTAHPITGGAYIWVEKAFGKQWGFFASCVVWLSNVIWYPTIFSLTATFFAYLISPELVANKFWTLGGALILFWGITILNTFGIRISSLTSSIGALLGVILPTAILIIFGMLWLADGKPSQISFNWGSFFPNFGNYSHWAFLTQVVVSFLGIEMSAVHAGDIRDPRRSIPKAMGISAIFILLIVIAAPLSIAIVIPAEKISIISGMIQALQIFFQNFQISSLIFLFMLALIFIGNVGATTAWMIGVTRGMHVASTECKMPAFFQMTNKHHAPVGILILEGCIFTIAISLFFFATIDNAYWILLQLASQISLIYYVLIFYAAIKLKKRLAAQTNSFQIKGGARGTMIAACLASLSSVVAIVLGFFPPTAGSVSWNYSYPIILAIGIALCMFVPFVLLRLSRL